jgi:hypothetical protein
MSTKAQFPASSGHLFGTFFVTASLKPGARKLKDTDRTAIMAVLTNQQNDWNKGDIPGFMAGYWNSSELTFAGTRGFTRGWQPVMERYRKSYADKAAMGTLDFRNWISVH